MRLNLKMTPLQMVIAVSEGNPGAITVLMNLISMQKELALIAITNLDDMKIYGSNIWVAFKDYCNQNLQRFMDVIMDLDQGFLIFMKPFIVKKENLID